MQKQKLETARKKSKFSKTFFKQRMVNVWGQYYDGHQKKQLAQPFSKTYFIKVWERETLTDL